MSHITHETAPGGTECHPGEIGRAAGQETPSSAAPVTRDELFAAVTEAAGRGIAPYLKRFWSVRPGESVVSA